MSTAKITIIGDIMCEPRLLKASKSKGHYNFDGVFQNVKDLFKESDYVIGNLETPLAGKEKGYTNGLFSFNTPDEFADAVKASGIDLVTTANNHCFDRGIDGMIRTLEVLEKKDIPYTGTYKNAEERTEAHYVTINNKKIAIISYTYGTNYSNNRIVLDDSQKSLVNLLRPQQERYFVARKNKGKVSFGNKCFRKFLSFFNEEKQIHIKKFLGKTYYTAHADDMLDETTAEPYVKKLHEDISLARKNADIVLFYPHIGGQFNLEPGIFSDYIFDKAINAGCDAIIASHVHNVQKAEKRTDIPCFYSIGNFSMSPNSVYLLHDNLPDYGLAVHLYIEESGISKITFTVLKMLESKKQSLTVYPVDKLYNKLKSEEEREQLLKDTKQIFTTVTGRFNNDFSIESEYLVF
ncbi:MAG: CapA family protein [Ruminococcus sp.]|nr:CapA family protein [Ruminococcus sp.]